MISPAAPLTTQQLLFGRARAAAPLPPSPDAPDGATARARRHRTTEAGLPRGRGQQRRPASK